MSGLGLAGLLFMAALGMLAAVMAAQWRRRDQVAIRQEDSLSAGLSCTPKIKR